MLVKVANHGIISVLLPNIIQIGVIGLFYADHTILFFEYFVSNTGSLKWLLSCFELLSGMKINFHNSGLLTINLNGQDANLSAQIFCCKIGSFHLKYLGAPPPH